MNAYSPYSPCECADHENECGRIATTILFLTPAMALIRTGAEDNSGTRFCSPCADRAIRDGLYADTPKGE
jgi:hypothetical protein